MTKPISAPAPRRLIRSRVDDYYDAGHPTPYKHASAGMVVSIQNDTCTVLVLDEELTGVIPLGTMPSVGDFVEVEARGQLLCIPLYADSDAPPPGNVIIRSRPGNSVYVEDHYDYTSPSNWPPGDSDLTTYRQPDFNSGESHGDYGVAFIVESWSPDPRMLIGSETITSLDAVIRQRGVVVYSSLYPVTVEFSGGDNSFPIVDGPAGNGVTVTGPWVTESNGWLSYAVMFATAFEAAPTYSVAIWEWFIETEVPAESITTVSAMAAAEGDPELNERWLIVPGEWVQRYNGDGTQSAAGGVAQGVLDRDAVGDPDEAGSGNEASLVGFHVELPDDAQVTQVRLQSEWTDWLYPNGVGSLMVGWHSHDTAPEQWSVGEGDAQLSDHDVRDRVIDLRLSWGTWAVTEDSFRGVVIGPGWNDGGLYAGSTSVDPSRWTLAIKYTSAT